MRFLFYIIICLLPILSIGQKISYHLYTTNDGLPSNEVYDIIQDAKGYLWISTDRGVARYDGYDFTLFTTDNGLHNNVILRLYEDAVGKIWFVGMDGQLSCHEKNKIVPYMYNDVVKEHQLPWVEDIKVENDNILFRTISGNFFISSNGKYQKLNSSKEDYLQLFLSDVGAKEHLRPGNKNSIFFNSDSIIYIGIHNNLYQVSERRFHLIQTFESSITGIALTKEGLFVSVINEGLYKVEENNKTKVFPCSDISEIYFSDSQNLWVSTLSKGILKIRFPLIYHIGDNDILKVVSNKSGLYWAERNGSVYKKNKTTQLLKQLNARPYTLEVFDDVIFFGDEKKEAYVHYPNNNTAILPRKLSRVFFGDSSHYYLFGIDFSIYDTHFNLIERKENLNIYSYAVFDKKILLGTSSGIHEYDLTEKELSKISFSKKIDNDRINSICRLKNTLVLGTMSNGVVIYNTDNKKKFYVNTSHGLPSNQINHLYVDYENVLWVSTSKGLIKIENATDTSKLLLVKFTHNDGLPSTHVNMSCVYNDTVWVATSKGLAYFPKNIKKISVAPKLYIDLIKVGEEYLDKSQTQNLNYHQNSITIKFVAISVGNHSPLKYKFRLLSKSTDSSWMETSDRYINLASLKPDNYLLEIKSTNIDGTESNIEKIILNISPPFWKTWWFMLLFIVGISGVLFGVVIYRTRQLRVKEMLLDTQQQILGIQMNPHFIFNTLNSIHNYLIQNDVESSAKYLSKFSKLMRQTMEHSREKLISVTDELAILELYLSIEKLRFKNKLNYTVDVNKAINLSSFHIPPLLLQPFVENAIWHGILNKETEGNIHIKVDYFNEDIILCVIEDDGIGRGASKEINKNKIKHHSAGLGITQKRVDLIKKIYKRKIYFEVKDLFDNGKPCGTRIELYLQKITNNHESNNC